MRAFILRRVELIAHGIGDVVLVGSTHSRRHAAHQGVPHAQRPSLRATSISIATPTSRSCSIASTSRVADVPVLICRGEVVLRNPTNQQIADCLGFNDAIDQTHVRDVVDRRRRAGGPRGGGLRRVGGARRAGARVERARRPGGLELEDRELPRLSDRHLRAGARRPRLRAGAEVRRRDHDRARARPQLTCDRKPYAIADRRRTARAGAHRDHRHRRANTGSRRSTTSSQFEGAGVYYGATFIEAQLCDGEEVIVVGGGNSAGQAAVFLAQTAGRVHMLVRSGGLAETHVALPDPPHRGEPGDRRCAPRTEIVGARRRATTSSACAGATTAAATIETHDIRHVFVMTGAVPNTDWLDGCVALDAKGFIKTGPDLSPDDLAAARWPLARRAASARDAACPGVFAVGDVRGGNIKRVASAVGEGSIAVAFVHQVLHE